MILQKNIETSQLAQVLKTQNEMLSVTTIMLVTNSLGNFKQRGIRLLKDHEAQKTRI